MKNCTPLWRKTVGFGALLEIEMLKNARRCGETHVEVKKCKKLTASAFGS